MAGQLFSTFHRPYLHLDRLTPPVRDRRVRKLEYKVAAGRVEKLVSWPGKEVQMQAVTQDTWKEHVVRIETFPVRRITARDAVPDGYIATIRIERGSEVLVDWHLPFFAERWLSEGEARRDALEYAVKLIDSGVLEELQALRERAA